MTLPSAFSIELLTPACSRSSSISIRLTRCRCRPRSPHAGQQQPITGSSHSLTVVARFVFGDVDQRADHHVFLIVGDEPRRHRLERAREEQVQQQRFDEIVEVMAERDLRGADFRRDAIEHAAAQPRAERAGRRVGFEQVVHHVADGGVLDAVFPAPGCAGAGEGVVLVVLVAGVDVDGDDAEVDRRALPQLVQDVQERPAVLAARQADHHAIAVLDEQVKSVMALVTFLATRGFERRPRTTSRAILRRHR